VPIYRQKKLKANRPGKEINMPEKTLGTEGEQGGNEALLQAYAAKQEEVARLIRERESMVGGLSPISMSEPIRTEKIEKEYGPKAATAFTELQELQKMLDNKGLKAPSMEERGL
jgi:hypothetical protein